MMNSEEYLISIIMPTFNRKWCIDNAINSILNQSYNNWELIIVDDSSEDLTTEYIGEKYFDKRIQIHAIDGHVGAGACRNYGIEISRGEIITFIDSDGEYDKDKLKNQLTDLIYFRNKWSLCKTIYKSTLLEYEDFSSDKKEQEIAAGKLVKYLKKESIVDTAAIMAWKELIVEVGGFDKSLRRMQDYDLAIKLINKADYCFSRDAISYNKITENSIVTNENALLDASLKLFKKHRNFFDKEDIVLFINNIENKYLNGKISQYEYDSYINGIVESNLGISKEDIKWKYCGDIKKTNNIISFDDIDVNGGKIFIYGDRRRAAECSDYIHKKYPEVEVLFVVTNKSKDDKRQNVIQFDEKCVPKDGIILITVVYEREKLRDGLLRMEYKNVYFWN